MDNICLEEAKINFEGTWLSVDDMASIIKRKINDDDLKFANLAVALEQLNRAIDNTYTIEGFKFVISKDEYEKLTALGGNDVCDCLKKAVKAYIKQGNKKEITHPFYSKHSVTFDADKKENKENNKSKRKTNPFYKKHSVTFNTETKKAAEVKCIKCKTKIKTSGKNSYYPLLCPKCIASNQLELLNNKHSLRYRDHYLG